jgi:hypothetical protein
VALSANAFRRRQFASGAPGKQPGFHVFVSDVVAGLDLAVGLANFGEQAFLVGDVGFDGVGDEEVGAAAGGFGEMGEALFDCGF